MFIKTGRFGQIEVGEQEIISIPQGLLGFPEYTQYCLVDPADDTLIMWLQSLENPDLAFPVLEPKIFKETYQVKLSGSELRELKLESVNDAAVFSVLTIGEDIAQMTANLKAPLVINLKDSIAKQVVLQENEYTIKFSMFKELKTHILTIQANQPAQDRGVEAGPVQVRSLPPADFVSPLYN